MMKALIGAGIIFLLALLIMPWWQKTLPPAWNPFTPLTVTDAPGWMTRYKLKRLQHDPEACMAALQRAKEGGYIRFSLARPVEGNCPLAAPVRVQGFSDVRLSSSFLASCSLALSTTMFVTAAKSLAAVQLGSPLVRIDHVGSYACRNIYHRATGRLSEHATAEALDVAGFRLQDGREIAIQKVWGQPRPEAYWLRQIFQQSCFWYGNALGPDYNRAHAAHFHLGMRGFGVCR